MKEDKIEKKRLKMMEKAIMEEMSIDKEELKKLKKKLLKAKSRPERGIETWFRLASRNLYTRLQIVDTKANILITANAIIISMVLGTLYGKLEEDPHLVFAVGGLVITNVLSISFAILATIPESWVRRDTTDESIEETIECTDLMTFEDFSALQLSDYTSSVMKVISDGETLYPSLIKDIYDLGIKLSKKYRLIRVSYLIFLYGIILSVVAFAFCHIMLTGF
jgi:hypothetical protein